MSFKSSWLMFCWLFILLSQHQPASSLPAVDNSLKFKQNPAGPKTVCAEKRNILVKIGGEDGPPVSLTLTESSREFLHSEARPDIEICFYQGSLSDDEAAIAVAVQRGSLFSGTFHFRNAIYEIPPQLVNRTPLSASIVPSPGEPRKCGLASSSSESTAGLKLWPPQFQHPRQRRSALLDTNSGVTVTDRKYIRLILIGDQHFYSLQGNSTVAALSRLWEIGNYINAFYKQLGVNVMTVFVEVWQTDPYVTFSASSSAGANSTEMLNNFMDYKMRQLNSRPHSSAQLVSGLKMTGSDVGLAHLGKLCHSSLGGGVNSDRDANAIGVAITVAHELGHNLGMVHDEDERGCHCPDTQGCIMTAVGSEINPVRFSNCSVFRYQDFSVDNGLGYCMSDPPSAANLFATRRICGNRIVEPGEDCDCGPPQWCNNTCCNPSTCKFSTGAACASGQCCNLTSCSLKPQGVVCRPRKRSCDLEEYCNGTSEWCPEFDDFMIDGSECISGQAHCYNGRCSDRNTRCSVMFSPSDFRAAPAFYSEATVEASPLSYCGYNMTRYNPVGYSYTACSQENRRCGLLYCTSNLATGEPVPVWKGAALFDAKVLEGTINSTNVIAAFMQLDLGSSGYRDPGLVPNGAECGSGRMCVDSRCVAINTTRCPNCNGNGWCTQSGQCFCSPGFAPPNCLVAGTGGSLTNHPPYPATTTSSTTPTTTTPTATPTKTTSTTTTSTTTTPTPTTSTATTPTTPTTTKQATTTPTTTAPTTTTPTTTTPTTSTTTTPTTTTTPVPTTPTTTTPTTTTSTTTAPTTPTTTTPTPTTTPTTPTTTTPTTTTPTTTTPVPTTPTRTTPTTTTPTTTPSTTTTPTTTTPTTTTPTTTTPTTTTPTTTTPTTTTPTTTTPTTTTPTTTTPTPTTTLTPTTTPVPTTPTTTTPTTTKPTTSTPATTTPTTTNPTTTTSKTTTSTATATPKMTSVAETTTTKNDQIVTVFWPREAAYHRCSLLLSLLSPTFTVLLATCLSSVLV